MGVRFTRLQPVHSFATEISVALAIEVASSLASPTINTAIVGVGATKRFSAVRWAFGVEIVTAWILTFPVYCLIAYTVTKISFLFF